ncbi:SDR family oxidoreductase [Gordonia sp. DT219]|uniref:SDR family oxidoreductase n=1 Tax=Gordonia sp. DT219 TaxID=3416658 RepID=UPI003CF513A0
MTRADTAPGTVLITGGASGLGAATVDAVRKAGGTPLVLDRAEPAPGVEHRRIDLADTAAVGEAIDDLVAATTGRLDGVLTAAGSDACGRLEDVDRGPWEQVISVNLLGTAAVARAAIPHLRQTHGRIVTCASTLGLRALPDATAYCASKFGVVGFSRALAAELAGEVGVTTLVPGGMSTAFFDGRPDQYKPPADVRLNDPADVAQTVLFALSQPSGCEIRELVVCESTESSWP